MRDFKKLKIWENAHLIALKIYKITRSFPKDETYGCISQMRNSATSVAANIAEGCGRDSEKELVRFCHIAMGSASELEYFLLLSKDLNYIEEKNHSELHQELISNKKQLNAFIQRLRDN